jgi:capreomycidine synthase
MRFEPAKLEDWLRDYYFDASIDISSSGVEPYTFGDIQQLLGIDPNELYGVSFRDSRSAGAERLRRLVADRYRISDPSRVLVANGSTEAQLLVLMATLSVGDEVVVIEPAYHSLVETVRALGCHLVRWQLRIEDDFRPDLDVLEKLVHVGTKMIVVNFPHNPTGATVTRDEQLRLIDIAARNRCILFWDGAFEDLVLHGAPLPPVAAIYDKGMSFGSMSKSFGLPGLRVGWGALPSSAVVKAAVAVRDYTTLALSPLVEFIAERALGQVDAIMTPRLRLAGTNRAYVLDWLARHAHLLSCSEFGGGVIAFVRLLGINDTERFCHRLMTERRVLLVPGECFGMPGYVRLGFGGNSDHLHRGLDELGAAVTKYGDLR